MVTAEHEKRVDYLLDNLGLTALLNLIDSRCRNKDMSILRNSGDEQAARDWRRAGSDVRQLAGRIGRHRAVDVRYKEDGDEGI